jgi:hypothetical protein
MPTITFETKLVEINGWTIAHLPLDTSAQLPSRGLVMVKGTINGSDFQIALEPDGRKSHWFEIDDSMREALGVSAGDTVHLEIEPTKEWIEPNIPKDILDGLMGDSAAYEQWNTNTPMARWEWIRWIRATNRPETRANHIVIACSKLRGGARRPCCFNASMCTVPEVSKNGVLQMSELAVK